MDSKAAGQFGVIDLAVAHRQIERESRRQSKRHGHQPLTALGR